MIDNLRNILPNKRGCNPLDVGNVRSGQSLYYDLRGRDPGLHGSHFIIDPGDCGIEPGPECIILLLDIVRIVRSTRVTNSVKRESKAWICAAVAIGLRYY